ncbi:MAG TPA: lipocalin family protein [Bacteroidales bacterium]|nr:lipocalin family protein [Bacteroidales bacterium]
MATKIYTTICTFVVYLFLSTGCSSQQDGITGSWVQPIPGQEGKCQGINLEQGGKASSINMSTLLMESWKVTDNNLIISGKSIGNGQTICFTDTLVVKHVSKDTLVLKKGNMDMIYTRGYDNK